jgi:hypothetical protein
VPPCFGASRANWATDTPIRQLGSVRRRLENVDVSLETADESMRHYFSQIDQFTAVAKITCGVDMRWQDVEPLRKAYSSRRISGSFGDDHRDHRVVSGDLHDSPGSDANAQRRVSPRLSPRQTVSPVLGAAGTGAPMPKPPKRKSTIASTMPSLFHLNLTPWPRRSYLDPSGTTRVDPIRMAELTLEDVRRRAGEVGTLRRGARESLQGMIAEVDGLIRQKDQVRAWTKNALGKVGTVRLNESCPILCWQNGMTRGGIKYVRMLIIPAPPVGSPSRPTPKGGAW